MRTHSGFDREDRWYLTLAGLAVLERMSVVGAVRACQKRFDIQCFPIHVSAAGKSHLYLDLEPRHNGVMTRHLARARRSENCGLCFLCTRTVAGALRNGLGEARPVGTRIASVDSGNPRRSMALGPRIYVKGALNHTPPPKNGH